MYRLLSPQVIVDNVVILASHKIQSKSNINTSVIKSAYCEFLSELQPHCPYTKDARLFYADAESEQLFLPYHAYKEIEILREFVAPQNPLYPQAEERKAAIQKSLTTLKTIDPTFVELFHLIMNTVLCTTTDFLGGGTSVNQEFIGVMCAYYDMDSEERAIPESLIHEFTHTALFLDELRYTHYQYDKMREQQAQIPVQFGGDSYSMTFRRCLHSLFVHAEVLIARDLYIGHGSLRSQHLSSPEIIKRAKIYIDATEKNSHIPSVMTERSRMLFDVCKQFYSQR